MCARAHACMHACTHECCACVPMHSVLVLGGPVLKRHCLCLLAMPALQDEGAIALAEAIAGNQIITQLELGNNQIGDRGAMAIAKVGCAAGPLCCCTCCTSAHLPLGHQVPGSSAAMQCCVCRERQNRALAGASPDPGLPHSAGGWCSPCKRELGPGLM